MDKVKRENFENRKFHWQKTSQGIAEQQSYLSGLAISAIQYLWLCRYVQSSIVTHIYKIPSIYKGNPCKIMNRNAPPRFACQRYEWTSRHRYFFPLKPKPLVPRANKSFSNFDTYIKAVQTFAQKNYITITAAFLTFLCLLILEGV